MYPHFFYRIFSILLPFVTLNGIAQKNVDFEQLHQLAGQNRLQAVDVLNQLNYKSFTPNQEAQFIWYKLELSPQEDTVKYYLHKKINPNTALHHKAMISAAKGGYYLRFTWNPTQAKPLITDAYQSVQNTPKAFSKFETTYIMLQYAILQYALSNYNKGASISNAVAKDVLQLSNDLWTLRFLNSIILTNVSAKRPDLTIKYSQRVKEFTPTDKTMAAHLGVLFNNLGQTEIVNANYYQALQNQLEAKKLFYITSPELPYEWYWHMGWLHSETGNFLLANQYITQAKELIIKREGKTSYDYFLIQLLSTQNLLNQNDLLSAKQIIDELEPMQKKLHIDSDILCEWWNIKGRFYALRNENKKALHFYTKAYKKRMNDVGETHFNLLDSYRNLITIHFALKNTAEVNTLLQKSQEIIQKYYPNSNLREILDILSIDALLQSKTNTPLAIQRYQTILQRGKNNDDWQQLGYTGLARTYFNQYKKNKNDAYLQKAITAIDSAQYLANKRLIFLHSENDKLNYQKDQSTLRNLGLQIAFEGYKKNPADLKAQNLLFSFVETTKQNALKQSMLMNNFKSFSGINTDLFHQEKAQKSAIQSYKKVLNQNTQEKRTKKQIKQSLDSLETEYRKTLVDISETASLYHNYFLNNSQVNITQLRSTIAHNDAFILYATSNTDTYIIYIDKTAFQAEKVALSNLKEKVEQLNNAAKNNHLSSYKQIAFELYNYLLLPFSQKITNKNGYVSLDSDLYGINLEALLTDSTGNNFGELHYVLKMNQIQYILSAETFYFKKQYTKQQQSRNASIFSIQDFSENQLTRQPFMHQSLQRLAKKNKARFYENDKATKNSFITELHNANDLIIGTHTILNPKNPMYSRLIFASDGLTDSNLYTYEILEQQQVPSFVALLSCSSTQGETTHGFGLLSLANSFLYAGSQSLLCTLWNVDEKTTATLTEKLFIDTQSKTLSQSLRNTKLAYLKNTPPDSRLASPYYWAGIINYGDYPLPKHRFWQNKLFLMMPALLALLMLVFFFVRRK